MDKQNNGSSNESWLDDILGKRPSAKEYSFGEAAAAADGLTRSDDDELERIVRETMEENWGEEPTSQKTPSSDTQFFSTSANAVPQEEATQSDDAANDDSDGSDDADNDKPKTFWQKLKAKEKAGYGLFGIPHILATVIWCVLIFAIGTSLGRTLWLCAADVLALGKTPQETTITVDVEDRMPDIAQKLHEAGMIRYPNLFVSFAELTGKGSSILVGSITFSGETIYDYNALINAMSYRGGSTIVVEVMIPEGYSCAQIFSLLEEKGVCSASELEKYAADGDLDDYWFLKDIKRGHKYCLEGFLFPDTYQFYMDDEPRRVLEKFLDDFEYRFTNRMVDKFVALNTKTGLNLTLHEVITMASIIEKEKSADLEGYKISSVFYNRMMKSSVYPTLDSDATVLYAIDYYNKGELVTDEQINASPFNTYTHAGLPPSPIANPGLSSLDAALEPEDTDYYFFLLDRTAGHHVFSRTLAEHEQKERELGYT